MTNSIGTLLVLLATSSAAFAQLTVATIPKSTLAVEMSSDASFQSLLANTLYTPQNVAGSPVRESFNFNSASPGTIHFNLIGITDPLPLPQTFVNPASLSLPQGFIASFVTEVKDDTNNFGADNGGDYNRYSPITT